MTTNTTIDPGVFRNTLGRYPTGVSIVTSADASGNPVGGMTAGTFSSVSLDPPIVSFMPMKSSTSWPKIAETGHFLINVLSAEQEELCRAFSKKGTDKFAGVAWTHSPKHLPVLEGAVAWVECSLRDVIEAGDHLIVLGDVLDLGTLHDGDPLIFYGGKFNRPQQLAS